MSVQSTRGARKGSPAKAPAKPEVKPEPKPEVIKIVAQPEKGYRANSARAVYWDRFNKYNGKPVAELEKSCTDDPPSTPKKGTYQDKQEPFGGWLSFFRQAKLVVTTAPAK